MRPDEPAPTEEARRDAAPASLAARIGSLVPAAADPHTQAITIWNGAPLAGAGWIAVDLNLRDAAEGYELVDAEGEPMPHRWLGDMGTPPIRLDLTRSEIPDFEGIMARLDGDPIRDRRILELSMRVLRDTLHIEVTLGERDGLSRGELAESVRDALSLADAGGCGRIALTLHRAILLRTAVWVPTIPASGYTTLLVRPRARPKGGARTRKFAALPTELLPVTEKEPYRGETESAGETHRDARLREHDAGGTPREEIVPFPERAAPSPGQQTFAYAAAHADVERRTLSEVSQAVAGDLWAYVGPCAEGILPPSGSVVKVSPKTVVVGAFQWAKNGEGAVLQVTNQSNRAEVAQVELLIPAQTAILTNLDRQQDEILWEDEPRATFTVAVPPREAVTIRLRL